MSINKPTPGATLHASGATLKTANVEKLVIDTEEISKISHDYSDSSIHSIPNSKALNDALLLLKEQLELLDPDNNFFRDNTVLSLPLISSTFTENDSDWQILNWSVINSSVSFVGSNVPIENYIGIPPKVIPFDGEYFLLIDIPRLDSGKIVLYDNGGEKLKEMPDFGKYSIILSAPNADVATWKFVAEGVFPGEVVTISSIMLNRVTPRLKAYMEYMFSGGSGELTYQQVLDAINVEKTNILNILTATISSIEDDLYVHLQDIGNPHQVTPTKIGAAPVSHTHTLVSLGASPVVHTHQPEECGAAPAEHTHTISDFGAAPLDHTHTPAEIGAAPVTHGHLPDEVGAAPINHIHTPVQVGAAPVVHEHTQYTTQEALQQAILATLSQFNVGTSKNMKPLTILSGPVGSIPTHATNINLSNPICPLILPYLVHRSSGPYDYYEGVVSTNIPTLPEHPIQYAFKKHLTLEDHLINVAAFFSTVSEFEDEVLVEYYFHTPRTISGFKLFKDETDTILGVPIIFDLIVDGNIVESFVEESTTLDIDENPVYTYWAESSYSLEKTLQNGIVYGRRFSFIIKKAHLDYANKWGIRIEFIFDDVTENTIRINSEFEIGAIGTTSILPIVVDGVDELSLPETDSKNPIYLYLQSDIVEDESIQNLDYTLIKPEYSQVQLGVPAFLDKFTGKIHPQWGTISVTDEDPTYLIENVYSSNSDLHWKTNDTITAATITHDFLEPVILSGYKLLFTEYQINNRQIPDRWLLQITTSTSEIIIVDSVSDYLPPRLGGDINNVWYKNDFDDVTNVIKLELILRGTKNQTNIGLSQFIPMLESIHYDISTLEIYPENVFPLGRLDKISNHDNSWSGFIHSGFTLGAYCHIPIDGLAVQPNSAVVHNIPNMYNTKDIEVTINEYPVEGPLAPASLLNGITEDTITVLTYAPGMYSIKVKRLW